MTVPPVHCNINENTFSWTIFLTRLLCATVLIYVSVGCLLYYREFLYNAAVLGIPVPVGVGIGLLVLQLFLALLLVLGLFSRFVAGASIFCLSAVAFIFFGADLNKIYIALIVLLMTALLPTLLLGPGKLSLDFNEVRRRVAKEFRG